LEMPFGGCNGLREMFAEELSRQPRPSGKIAGVDGFEPSGLGWAEAGTTVQVGNLVALVAHLVDIVGVLADEHVMCWRSGREGARKWCGHWRVGEADVPEAVVVIAVAAELADARSEGSTKSKDLERGSAPSLNSLAPVEVAKFRNAPAE
jgi:hypothetical protein